MAEQIKKLLQTGKKYRCAVCGMEVLVFKAGAGSLSCCNTDMVPVIPPPVPKREGLVPF